MGFDRTAMSKIAEKVADKFLKLAWVLTSRDLPDREATSYVNFCIHTEMLYNKRVYEALLRFSEDFRAFTGHRITVSISTPRCPVVKEALAKGNVTPDIFVSRVLCISEFADIGYHGHFYQRSENGFVPVLKNNYDKNLVLNQIRSEIDWFRNINVFPKVYIGGWWFLSEEIIIELENSGVIVDVSLRKDKDNTFGDKYLDDIPDYGKPFMLRPSKNILEIQSIFGPVMITPMMKKHLSVYLEKYSNEVLFFIFPLHDWDILRYHDNIWRNVVGLKKFKKSIDWMDIIKMREIFLSANYETR